MTELTPKECLNQFLSLLRMTDLAYAKLLKNWDLSLNLTWALEYLYSHPEGVEPTVLAESTRMLRQTVTVVLNDLEKRRFIRRALNPADRRRNIVKLTPSGKIFASKVLEEIEKIELCAVQEMSAEERDTLIRLTTRFYEGIAKGADFLG